MAADDEPMNDERRRFLHSIEAVARALRDSSTPEFGHILADQAIEAFVQKRFGPALLCADRLLLASEEIADEWAPFVGVLRMHCLRHMTIEERELSAPYLRGAKVVRTRGVPQ